MDWNIKIEKTDNGYFLTCLDGEGSHKLVYKMKDEDDETNRDHIIEMFYEILDFFGESGSKHDKRRIKICYISGNEFDIKEVKKGVGFEVIE